MNIISSIKRHIREALCAIAFLVVSFTTFGIGIFAILNHRDDLLQIISLSLGFGSLLLALIPVLIAFNPNIIGNMWKTLRISLYILIILFLVLSSISAVGLGSLVLQEPIIKIGVSLPFGSSDSSDAIPMFDAIKLAISDGTENRKIGKYTIQLVPFDDSKMDYQKIQYVSEDTGTPKGNVEDFTTITGDAQIAGIIGPFNSGTATYEIPLTNKVSLALISPATTADCLTTLTNIKGDNFEPCEFSSLNKNKEKSFFRMAAPDSLRAEVLTGYFWQEKMRKGETNTAKEAVIFNDKSLFGRSFANRLQEAWKNKMNKKAPILDLTDDPRVDLKTLKPKPDVILFAGTGPKAIELHKAMKETGYSETALAAAATIMRGGVPNPVAKGDIYAISPYGYFDELAQYSKFRADYKNKYHKEPTPYSASAYDATMLLLKSIKEAVKYNKNVPVTTLDIFSQADQFRTAIIRDIKRVNSGGFEYTGVTGTYHFDLNGDTLNHKGEKEATIYKHIQGTENEWEHVPYNPEK